MKRGFFFIISFVAALSAMAHQLTPSEALSRLRSSSPSKSLTGMTLTSDYQLSYSSSKGGKATYYVFDNPSRTGFVVVSGDDCMPALLGEVNGMSFDYDKIPCGMKWLLSEYDKVISNYIADGKTYTATSVAGNAAISPLLGNIEWDQETPYNKYCPAYNGTHAYTGCMATAMAQIMKCFNYPERGIGSNTYTYNFERSVGDSVTRTETSDFSQHEYDWGNMRDTYVRGTGWTSTEGNAVAQLLYDCGVSVNMEYGMDGSGSMVTDATAAFNVNFDYTSAHVIFRDFYTDDEWETMIYEELEAGRPVLYTGTSTDAGGHAFVCDGFLDGRFHINWGWSGGCNNYFLLTATSTEKALCPDEAYGSFTEGQSVIAGIQPRTYGKVDYCGMAANDYTAGKLDTSTGKPTTNTTFTSQSDYLCVSGGFISMCSTNKVFDVGIKLSDGTNTYYIVAIEDTIPPFKGFSWYCGSVTNVLKNGTYTVTPVYKNITDGDTEWKEMLISSAITKPTVTVQLTREPYMYISEEPLITSGGRRTYGNQVLKTSDGVDMTLTLNLHTMKSVSKNHSIMGYIYPLDNSASKNIYMYNKPTITISAGNDVTMTLDNTYNMSSLESGKSYYIVFIDYYKASVSSWQMYLPNWEYNLTQFTVVDSLTDPCDVNCDGSVNVSDVSITISVICGTKSNYITDVNNDGTTNVSDVSAIISAICGD